MSAKRDVLQRWQGAGKRLSKLDADRFERVLALVETYVGVYENEDEDTFRARLRRAAGAEVN